MPAKDPFQVLGGVRPDQCIEALALTIEQQERHVADPMLSSKTPAFVGPDIGD